MPEPDALVSFNKIGYRHPRFPDALLENVSFDIRPAESLVLTGPAGNGKSTAIAMALGGVRPSAGKINLFGMQPILMPANDLDALRARIGYVPQSGGLLSNISLTDNIGLPLRYHRSAGDDQVRIAIEKLCAFLKIEEFPAMPSALAPVRWSRLAALARALILEPVLLILDEPARELVGLAKMDFWRLIARVQNERGCAVLAATSDAETAYSLGGKVVSLPARHQNTMRVARSA